MTSTTNLTFNDVVNLAVFCFTVSDQSVYFEMLGVRNALFERWTLGCTFLCRHFKFYSTLSPPSLFPNLWWEYGVEEMPTRYLLLSSL